MLDEGVLNAPSATDARQLLLARAKVRAVVSLPETTFQPYASVKASVLVLERAGRARGPCFFARAEKVGRRPSGEALHRINAATGKLELDDDLPGIAAAWRTRGRGPADGDGSWFLGEVDAAATDARLDVPFHDPSRRRAAQALHASPHPLRDLGELCELRHDSAVPAAELEGEEVVHVGLSAIETRTGRCRPTVVPAESVKSSVRRFFAGDVLYARLRPELRKVCLAPCAGWASAECLVLVPRRTGPGLPFLLHPELLALLLRSDLAFG